MSKLFVLILMIFCHIIDDYYLQGILASMKQKKWWSEHAPNKLYKHDYIAALLTHGLSWAFMIMLPIAIFFKFNPPLIFYIVFIINSLVHSFIDDLKANKLKINLITDQLLHLMQIAITFVLMTEVI